MRKYLVFILLLVSVTAFAQVDKKDVRRGNRQFSKAKYGDADISYRKGLNADSTSVPAAYDLGNNLYRQGNYAESGKFYQQALRHVPEVRNAKKQADYAFDTYFNAGDAALQQKQYRAAMEAFVQALLINPDDLEAKENYIYARKMLENNPDGGGGGNNDQNQDQDQQDQNQDQQNQDQNQNQDQQDQNQDQNQDRQDQNQQQKPSGGSEISPQQAQQVLQAIQAKEKETQDKVKKEKADVLKSRQKEKNW